MNKQMISQKVSITKPVNVLVGVTRGDCQKNTQRKSFHHKNIQNTKNTRGKKNWKYFHFMHLKPFSYPTFYYHPSRWCDMVKSHFFKDDYYTRGSWLRTGGNKSKWFNGATWLNHTFLKMIIIPADHGFAPVVTKANGSMVRHG